MTIGGYFNDGMAILKDPGTGVFWDSGDCGS